MGSFLPEGLELVPRAARSVNVKICRAHAKGPTFRVLVNVVALEDYGKISKGVQSASGVRPGSEAEKALHMDWAERYARRVIAGWEGCTVLNFEAINRAKTEIGGASRAKMIEDNVEIPFSIEGAAFLIINSFNDEFFAKIDAAARKGIGDLEDEDEGKGKP
jgi:hypothetical protein